MPVAAIVIGKWSSGKSLFVLFAAALLSRPRLPRLSIPFKFQLIHGQRWCSNGRRVHLMSDYCDGMPSRGLSCRSWVRRALPRSRLVFCHSFPRPSSSLVSVAPRPSQWVFENGMKLCFSVVPRLSDRIVRTRFSQSSDALGLHLVHKCGISFRIGFALWLWWGL